MENCRKVALNGRGAQYILKSMVLQYETYPYSPVLGWSISRFETFDKCKRCYFYTYYGKFATAVAPYKIQQLKALTSVPLEVGHVVHDVIEAFLTRLQKSDSNIDEQRFYDFARRKTEHYFATKTFMETYYKQRAAIDIEEAIKKIHGCLENFLGSSCYSWIFMKAMTNKNNWMIEPPGYGETRVDGLKAYCKMDFLFPVDGTVNILDWKTGIKNTFKHTNQLKGYAVAAHNNFGIPIRDIFPKIVYLYPNFDELEIALTDGELQDFFKVIKDQTNQMYGFLSDVGRNVPLSIDKFVMTPSPSLCQQCCFQELCFPAGLPHQTYSGEL
ncbi:MAG: PD-(D/E)XK nuclease family protein [Chitinivibrionales bacterium]|nr:PD-(D/E)XK nuclease family protein [Chitinivibrionales bacterium]